MGLTPAPLVPDETAVLLVLAGGVLLVAGGVEVEVGGGRDADVELGVGVAGRVVVSDALYRSTMNSAASSV